MTDDVRKWLRPLEKKIFDGLMLVVDVSLADKELVDVFTDLAACRALLKKHKYQLFEKGTYCIECGMIQGVECAPDCAIATALKGVGGE